MKIGGMRNAIERAQSDLEGRINTLIQQSENKTAVELNPVERIMLRTRQLGASTVRPSKSEQERILGTNDLVDLNFLQKGVDAARSVCRIVLRDGSKRHIGYASGFVVSPRLILTNHHVFPSAADAANALAQFEYELDTAGIERPAVGFKINPDIFHFADPSLDYALVAVETQSEDGARMLAEFPPLRLDPKIGKINKGEFISVIQHPSGSPKQVALRENKLLSIDEQFLVYASDTAQGSSGSPLFNDSWQIVGLHSAGVPRKNEAGQWMTKKNTVADADTDDSDIDWIGNRGARASRIVNSIRVKALNSFFEEFLELADRETKSLAAAGGAFARPPSIGAVTRLRVTAEMGGARIDLPAGYLADISGAPAAASPEFPARAGTDTRPTATTGAAEAYRSPYVDPDYTSRRGYDRNFLGVVVPMPSLSAGAKPAKLNGKNAIPYQHFSVVMRKDRRLAYFAAWNLDASKAAKEPESGRVYSRAALGRVGDNDVEKWVGEPRIGAAEQLPDEFFKNDRESFDKGHICRREDVTFGADYDEVERANGDTFHVTNCSPQVAAFNRSNKKGEWGLLENLVLKQAKTERLCVFAGPVFDDENDKTFSGEDADGSALDVQIPGRFWKVVIAIGEDGLESFAFILEQKLSSVAWEFDVPAKWRRRMISLEELQSEIAPVKFPAKVIAADQHGRLDEHESLTSLRSKIDAEFS